VDDLAEFLLARTAEDRAEVPADRAHEDYGTGFNLDNVTVEVSCVRWLTECEAKRRIVALHSHDVFERFSPTTYLCRECGNTDYGPVFNWCMTLRMLALPYADHPDYQESWRP
jgi:hypothetical protein